MALKLYVDMRSPPCRSLLMFLKNSKIEYELVIVDVLKGEHKKPEYSTPFRLVTVPGLQDGDFYICESVAIFRYLTAKFPGQFDDYWYPADLKRRALVDEYLAFHHQGIRGTLSGLVWSLVVIPAFTGQKPTDERVAEQEKECHQALDKFQKVFLGDKDFILGDDISFADVFVVNELLEYTITGRDFAADRPGLQAYHDRIKAKVGPAFDVIYVEFNKWKDSVLNG